MADQVNAIGGDGHPLAPIERRTLNEIAYARLKRALLSGRLEPGRVLTLRGLAASLGTSVMPIRDAVGRLAAEQACELLPNRGIRVPRLTPEHADELWRLRIALEGEAAGLAARRVTAGELPEIEQAARVLRSSALAGNFHGTLDANDALQFAIYRAAKTHVLLRLIETLRMQSMPYCAAYLRRLIEERPRFLFQSLDHSDAVVRALARRDARGAREAKRRDLQALRDWVKRCVAEGAERERVTSLERKRGASRARQARCL